MTTASWWAWSTTTRRTDLAFGYTYLGPGNLYTGDFAADSLLPGGAGSQPFDFDIRTTNYATAVYAQVMLSLFERTHLLIGARYDFSYIKRHNNLTGADDKKRDEALTLRFGLTQQLTENITAYALYAQSFNPSVDARSVSGDILDPETGTGYEVGIKTDWYDGRLGATLAFFLQELEDSPITDPNNNNFSINGGRQRTRGVEIEVLGSPYPGLIMGAASAWLDAEFIESQDENFGLTPNGIVDRQPSVYASYALQRGRLKGLGLGVTFVSIGDHTLLAGGTNRFVAGYERVDVSLRYQGIPRLDVSFHVRNLLDETYIERVRDNFQDNFFGSPRAFLFRVSYNF